MSYYNSISTGYEELHKEEQLKKIALIKEYFKRYPDFEPKTNDKLLDVGCGTGLTTIPWNCELYGIDPAKKLLERAHKLGENNKKIIYKQAQAENIPYPDNYFDFVISITAIQNFEDIEKGLSEIKRVGKKKFILSFLKKSKKSDFIKKLIYDLFKVKIEIEEQKDKIFFCEK
ncbi:MAG: methyltransferase domain-containing protein [Candidatus Woesearchaeota archaeon]